MGDTERQHKENIRNLQMTEIMSAAVWFRHFRFETLVTDILFCIKSVMLSSHCKHSVYISTRQIPVQVLGLQIL